MLRQTTLIKGEGQIADKHCSDNEIMDIVDASATNPEIVVCPIAFIFGGIDKDYPEVTAVTCDTIGPQMDFRTITLGYSW